jgi:hypothetical protein
MGCRADLVMGLGTIAGLLGLVRLAERRSIAAPGLVDPFVPALETDRLAIADAVDELVQIMIALRAVGGPAIAPAVPVGMAAAAGTAIGAACSLASLP